MRDCNIKVKPPWWNENHFFKHHRHKGKKTSSYNKLQHVIQDLINNGKIVVGGHTPSGNSNYKMFTNHFPKHEKDK